MSSSYYSDEEESVDVRVRRFARAPSPHRPARTHYIETVERHRERPSSYYNAGPVMLAPERTVVTTRSRSRERRSSSPNPQVAPVIIHNKIINEPSDDDYSSGSSHHGRRRHRSRSRHSHGHSRHSSGDRLEWELEQARRELEQVKVSQARDRDGRRLDKQYREGAELRRAKEELEEIKRREHLENEEKRLRKEIELKQLEEERRQHQEKEKRKKEAELAVAKYKAEEAERIEKEKVEKDRAEKEYQRRLQEDLIKSGVDEKDIAKILEKKKIKDDEVHHATGRRPTYTRMAVIHLEEYALEYYKYKWHYSEDLQFVLIEGLLSERKQDELFELSRQVRKKRKKDAKVVLQIEDKKHHHHKKDDDQFMWVHKKTERRRSKSPGLLMYLAGGKPA